MITNSRDRENYRNPSVYVARNIDNALHDLDTKNYNDVAKTVAEHSRFRVLDESLYHVRV